ncbi:hypothetical protein P7D22_04720 [Lichenihabitans sp. Uapishka_5]|uniref:hypothetical protein n=1 Tax=Lichenihabitans sp. Uapishka_5 TaxID=3037302 RepID=UPI0029E8160E|nr:hypothetical protein [Lichenihabitans sp. Uapishka_5]MDX7950482.1 hypothetical protein [Lichenihabitans sp. Uapishka_5]
MLTMATARAAAAAEDFATLRSMFVAIIHHPDQPLDGITDPAEIVSTFDAICGVLRFDLEPLPEQTFMLMWRLGLESHAALIGQSYGAAAQSFIQSPTYYAERFAGQHATA